MAVLFMIILILPLTVLSQDDPCDNYRILYDDGGRSIHCSRYYRDSHDRFITEGWRRVQLESTGEDLTMPTQCIEHGYCGSHSNVWLNGTHPTVEDGIVDRMGCLSMFSSCCYVQYPIQIKNCTDYMVYNLKKTLGSDERYCFGDSDQCFSSSTTSSTTTKTSEARPTGTSDTPLVRSTSRIIPRLTNDPENDKRDDLTQDRIHLEHRFMDEMGLTIGVCLSVVIAALISIILGIFLYLRKLKVRPEYTVDTKPTKAAIKF